VRERGWRRWRRVVHQVMAAAPSPWRRAHRPPRTPPARRSTHAPWRTPTIPSSRGIPCGTPHSWLIQVANQSGNSVDVSNDVVCVTPTGSSATADGHARVVKRAITKI